MPLRPWQPTVSSIPSSSSSLKYVHHSEGEEDKENTPIRRGKPGVIRKPRKSYAPNMLSRRNERERNRVHLLNLGFERLRAVVPKREGEHLSKISTLKKAIWYIEHLERVLHEDVASTVADGGVVGTGLGGVSSTLATSSSSQQQERLSPIFPARLDEPSPGSQTAFKFTTATPDSGYESSFVNLKHQELIPQPTRIWVSDFDATSTPFR
ncbi:unnamed protein product [Mesocestoides corti]|uniref:BHLH domain-containing protein n=1 Tax=Mesocestoides corti TaxID=53468 RepID=A0A0R3U3I4_MESCO|nr:unnamed protein product [Mesocestoides corti]